MDKESFFSRQAKPKTTEITLDDGQILHARKLSQSEVETIRKNYATEATALEGYRYIVSKCVVDEEGRRVFDDADKAKLLQVDFDDVQKIADAVVEFSGLNRKKA